MTPSVEHPLRYRGYVYDTDTGLYYLQSRYYDPKVGRYLNRDVVFDLDTGVQGYNLFAYCGNAPVFRIDVCGTDSDDIDPFDDDTRPEFHQDEGGSPYSGGNPNSIPFYCGSGTVSSGSGALTASGGGTYHYSVDCTVGGNSSIYSGGTWGSGYTAYSYYTQSSTSSSKHTAYNPLANITYTKKVIQQMQLGDDHGFPLIVDNYGSSGELSIVQNKYGVDHYRLTINGSYKGHSGYFEYIWNMSDICNHRFFVRR